MTPSAARPADRIGFVVGLLAEARIARRIGRTEIGGGTTAGAGAAAARLIEAGAGGLVSFGLAGGLHPTLRPGAILIPASVHDAGDRLPADAALTAALGGPTHDLLLASGKILATAAAKARAHQASGAAGVDMESGAVARAAMAAGLPWAVLRVVCDPAGRDLPPAALVAIDAAGAIGGLRVAAAVLRHPLRLPALIALAADAARARRSLLRRVAALDPAALSTCAGRR